MVYLYVKQQRSEKRRLVLLNENEWCIRCNGIRAAYNQEICFITYWIFEEFVIQKSFHNTVHNFFIV